jgi:hypothetical protein
VIDSLGCVHGYCALWDCPSNNRAEGGESPRFDIIAPRAITFAPDVLANLWHVEATA